MLCNALRCLRVLNDLKTLELAEKLGISRSYLSEIENGKKEPTLKLVTKYAEIFDTTPSAILFFSEKIDKESGKSKIKTVIMNTAIKMMMYLEKGKLDDEFKGENI